MMLHNEVVQRIKASREWQMLQEYVLLEVASLNTLDGIDFHDKESAAIEARARQIAREALKTILEPFYYGTEEIVDRASETKKRHGV